MYREITPGTPLNRYVEAFWYSTSESVFPRREIVYPDCCADIILTVSPSYSHVFITGVMTTAKAVVAPEETAYIGIRFKPGFAGFFIPSPLNEYTDLSVSSLPKPYEDIFDVLIPKSSIDLPQAVECLSNVLLEQLAKSHCQNTEQQIVQLNTIRSNRVSKMAERLGTSRRTLHRLYLHHFGLSPTQFNNIKRFRRFRSIAKSGSFTSLADLALASGYYDQADMTRHIKKIAGQTPAAFLSQLYNT